MIAETDSKKRGRPRVIPDELRSVVQMTNPDVKTERGLQNLFYRQSALVALQNDDRFKWLCDKAAMRAGAKDSWKLGILTELGRIEDPDDMIAIALEVCKKKPSTKTAVQLIRRFRAGEPEFNYADLLDRISAAACEYVNARPSVASRELMVQAFSDLAQLYSEGTK